MQENDETQKKTENKRNEDEEVEKTSTGSSLWHPSIISSRFQREARVHWLKWYIRSVSNASFSASGGVGRINRLPDSISANYIIIWFMKQQAPTAA